MRSFALVTTAVLSLLVSAAHAVRTDGDPPVDSPGIHVTNLKQGQVIPTDYVLKGTAQPDLATVTVVAYVRGADLNWIEVARFGAYPVDGLWQIQLGLGHGNEYGLACRAWFEGHRDEMQFRVTIK